MYSICHTHGRTTNSADIGTTLYQTQSSKKPGFLKKSPTQWVFWGFIGFLGFIGFYWVFWTSRKK